MYDDDREQEKFRDFYMPFGGKPDGKNRWVELSRIIPWNRFEIKYEKTLAGTNMGCRAKKFRTALGALIIQKKLNSTDRETVEQIRENPYMQYFIGNESYSDREPFDASLMVTFRKRINEQMLSDATCCQVDIRYPNDLGLLNDVREETEKMIDALAVTDSSGKKVRTYRNNARKEYLKVSKLRKKPKKVLLRGIRKQLQYIRRNISNITKYEACRGNKSTGIRACAKLAICRLIYSQQNGMYRTRTHSVKNRIVSMSRSHIRPIVRGKAGAEVEFGSKMTISVVNGYTFIDCLDFNNYNEQGILQQQIESYKKRFGYYPERVLADKIYQNRGNRPYCNDRGIHLMEAAPPADRLQTKDCRKKRRNR